MSRTVVLAAGGTAGHVIPAVAVARELVLGDVDVRPLFVGVRGRLEDRIVPASGFPLVHIPAVALSRRPDLSFLRLPFDLRRAIRRSEEILAEHQVAAVVAFGGYVSFPMARASWNRQLPLVVHEQNSIPGISNRIAGRWADRIAVTFPGSVEHFRRPEDCVVTGNPVGEHLRTLDRPARRTAALDRLELDPSRPTVLVFGGSQGSRSINDAVVASFETWTELGVQLLHVTGRQGFEPALEAWQRAGRSAPHGSVVEYLDDMSDAYAAADLVICRAGATSIAELSTIGLPSVLVPYPYATGDHQTLNARALESVGATVIVKDADLAKGRLAEVAATLIRDPDRRSRMAEAALTWGRPDAARAVARVILDQLGSTR
jgi:UDP-N-acetylglucosamine--N-acetylmuramyl-(pentapeptide) pyrophosphoryl-undecaprenol N-acetylglucosamine transferase